MLERALLHASSFSCNLSSVYVLAPTGAPRMSTPPAVITSIRTSSVMCDSLLVSIVGQ